MISKRALQRFFPLYLPFHDIFSFARTPSETLAQEFAEYVTLRKASSAAAAAAAASVTAKIVEPSAFYPQPTNSPGPFSAPAYRYGRMV